MGPEYDFSMWPEHARPRGPRLSLKFLIGALATGVVCAVAASAVYSEFARPPAAEAMVGRAWPLSSAADESRAAGGAWSAMTAKPSETTGAAPAADRPAKPPRAAQPSRQVALPTIGTTASAREDKQAKPLAPAASATPAPVAGEAASPANEVAAAPGEQAKPEEKPKVRKKARKKRPVEEAGVAQVYQYPDGRRVTVIRRSAENSDYGRPPPGYYPYPGRPGYYQ